MINAEIFTICLLKKVSFIHVVCVCLSLSKNIAYIDYRIFTENYHRCVPSTSKSSLNFGSHPQPEPDIYIFEGSFKIAIKERALFTIRFISLEKIDPIFIKKW